MTTPRHEPACGAPRFPGWRGWVVRLVAVLLALNFVLPRGGQAHAATAGDLLVICTAEGMVHVPAGIADDQDDKGAKHAPSAAEHCPICRIAGAAPLLPVPDFAVHTPQSIVETIARLGAETPMPEPAHPPGSLAARAPPASI